MSKEIALQKLESLDIKIIFLKDLHQTNHQSTTEIKATDNKQSDLMTGHNFTIIDKIRLSTRYLEETITDKQDKYTTLKITDRRTITMTMMAHIQIIPVMNTKNITIQIQMAFSLLTHLTI